MINHIIFQFYPIKTMVVLIVMGVSGSGKSTIGKELADKLYYEFIEGDYYHPKCNIEKMKKGIVLTDSDRLIWLNRLRAKIIVSHINEINIVLTCSALKDTYRKILRMNTHNIKFIYLKGSYDLIKKRLELRKNHFFNMDLLQNQMDTMEEPMDAVYIGIDNGVDKIITNIMDKINN
jgi:gluconokinase